MVVVVVNLKIGGEMVKVMEVTWVIVQVTFAAAAVVVEVVVGDDGALMQHWQSEERQMKKKTEVMSQIVARVDSQILILVHQEEGSNLDLRLVVAVGVVGVH